MKQNETKNMYVPFHAAAKNKKDMFTHRIFMAKVIIALVLVLYIIYLCSRQKVYK